MICVVIGRTRHKMMQIEVQEAGKRGAKLIELRLDFLAKPPDFKRLLADRPCPLVATVRRQEDGGRWGGTEQERRVLLRQAVVAGFDWVDIETDAAEDIRRFKDVKRIVSYHNLHETPADLEAIYERMCGQDADVIKLAVNAEKPGDALRVLKLLEKAPKPTAAHCMGDLGFPSRILGKKYNVPFTYAAFNKERGVAPGMPSFDELTSIYHYEQIDPFTKIFGVIGDPVAHSLSPVIHNAAFRRLGLNAVYVPFRVPRGQLASFLKDYARLPVSGYSVTIPHKEAALAAAADKEQAATEIEAANTLIAGDVGFKACNTDAQAIHDSIIAHLPVTRERLIKLSNWTALILGAGGVARAVAHVLQKEGTRIFVASRTQENAQRIATRFNGRAVPWEGRHTVDCQLLVNCTPVGMHPNVDDSPVHHSFLKPGLMVFDTVYTPENTLLIKEARTRNCHVVTGVDMFVRQAALQFRLFTGQNAPLELMREEVRRALSPLNWRGET
ncbi:MAG: shikimate dehydrogenase [Gemmataceae bacterium]